MMFGGVGGVWEKVLVVLVVKNSRGDTMVWFELLVVLGVLVVGGGGVGGVGEFWGRLEIVGVCGGVLCMDRWWCCCWWWWCGC